jgi:hypothetical protein
MDDDSPDSKPALWDLLVTACVYRQFQEDDVRCRDALHFWRNANQLLVVVPVLAAEAIHFMTFRHAAGQPHFYLSVMLAAAMAASAWLFWTSAAWVVRESFEVSLPLLTILSLLTSASSGILSL